MINPQFYIEWLALRALLATLKSGDMSRAWARMRTASTAVRWIGRSHWKWALRNLELVFGPQLDLPARLRLASIALEQHLGSYLEGFRSHDVTINPMNVAGVRNAYAAGHGVILATVHLGSWEPGLRWFAKTGLFTAVVYRRAFNPLSEREFQSVRASYGVEWIEEDNVTQTIRALRAGKVLILMTDLNTVAGGIPAEFLGLTAMCPAGPAKLALRYHCPVIPVIAIRERDAVVTYHCGEPITPADDGADGAAIPELTRRINAAFDPWIVEYAEQYNWFHPRWRCRPDGRVWTLNDPIERQLLERVSPHPPLSDRVRRLVGTP